jgi:hypothetical protein
VRILALPRMCHRRRTRLMPARRFSIADRPRSPRGTLTVRKVVRLPCSMGRVTLKDWGSSFGVQIMRVRSISLVLLLAAIWLPPTALAQVGDKKKDEPKKEADKITADTKVAGRTLSEWIEVISKKDRSETEIAIKNILLYPSDLAAVAVPVIIGELKKHSVSNPIDMSVRVNGAFALGHLLSTAKAASLKDPRDPSRDLVKEGVEQLQKMLTDKQVLVRIRAAQALGMMGTMAKKAGLIQRSLVQERARRARALGGHDHAGQPARRQL